MKIEIEIDDGVYSELEYIVELKRVGTDGYKFRDVNHVIQHVLLRVADGSLMPGTQARDMIQWMDLVSDHPAHSIFRFAYGDPEDI